MAEKKVTLEEVELKRNCTLEGKALKAGDKVKVTKAQVEVLKKHKLI